MVTLKRYKCKQQTKYEMKLNIAEPHTIKQAPLRLCRLIKVTQLKRLCAKNQIQSAHVALQIKRQGRSLNNHHDKNYNKQAMITK